MTITWPFFFFLMSLFRRAHNGGLPDLTTRAPGPRPSPPRPAPSRAPAPSAPSSTTPASVPTSTPPWPQAVPAGLPPFPAGWEPDEPVGPGVAARAFALLPQLWAYGAGSRKTEQTAGRWITYVATPMGSKKGVVAYRLRPSAATPPATPTATTVPASAVRDPTIPRGPSVRMTTLRLGSEGQDVIVLQKRLGLTADGKFGAKTRAAVIAYQRAHGLTPDGIVGPQTWTSLLTV